MSKSAYEAGKFVHTRRVIAAAAVLLSTVAAIGSVLMTGGIGYKVFIAYAIVNVIAFMTLRTARGSRRRAPARAASITRSAPPTAVRPVRQGTYKDGLRGIRVPIDDAVGLGIIDL